MKKIVLILSALLIFFCTGCVFQKKSTGIPILNAYTIYQPLYVVNLHLVVDECSSGEDNYLKERVELFLGRCKYLYNKKYKLSYDYPFRVNVILNDSIVGNVYMVKSMIPGTGMLSLSNIESSYINSPTYNAKQAFTFTQQDYYKMDFIFIPTNDRWSAFFYGTYIPPNEAKKLWLYIDAYNAFKEIDKWRNNANFYYQQTLANKNQ